MAAWISGKLLIHNGLLPDHAVRGSAASKPVVQNRSASTLPLHHRPWCGEGLTWCARFSPRCPGFNRCAASLLRPDGEASSDLTQPFFHADKPEARRLLHFYWFESDPVVRNIQDGFRHAMAKPHGHSRC